VSAELIAVGNHKGGVGKSFTAISLAAGLARAQWRCLLVDCDAQGNATSIVHPLADEQADGTLDIYDVVGRDVPVRDAIVSSKIDGLDLLPASLAAARLDQELVTKHRREEQIRRHLAPVVDDYDVIVMDLAPNLGAMVIAALCAATSLIVPTDASRWGLRAVNMFLTWSEALRDADVLTADLLGVLITMDEPQTIISKDVHKELEDAALPLFTTSIPKRTAANRMIRDSLLIGDPGADPDISEAYVRVTLETIERITELQAARGKHRG
jgi:chromosome partitioning protein